VVAPNLASYKRTLLVVTRLAQGNQAVYGPDTAGTRTSRSARFWLYDLEPLGGRLRFVFYAGLLVMLHFATQGASPLIADAIFTLTDPDFYTPAGVMSWIGVDWVSETLLRSLAGVGVGALICAALGLGRSVTPWIAAGCLLALEGVIQGAVGVTHRWHLAIYTVCLLCLARSDDGFSLDEWLAGRFPGYPRQTGPALFHTGFARKLVLLFAVATLFLGFTSKIIESGFAWGDGHTMQFDIARGRARWPWLAEQIIAHLGLAQLLAVGSLLIEGLSPVALFSRRARHAFVLVAVAFHVGISFVMSPLYLPQMGCYMLLVDWGAFGSWIRERRWQRVGSLLETTLSASASRCAQLAGTAIAVCLCVVAFARIEFWPITHIPMYSLYRGPAGAYSTQYFRDEAQLRTYAQTCVDHNLCAGSLRWIALELVASDGERSSILRRARFELDRKRKGARPKQLWRLFRVLVARIVVSRPAGELEFRPDAPESNADRQLRALLPAVRRSVPKRYERLEISVRLADGDVLLSSLLLPR
jgi:hypothetical protein